MPIDSIASTQRTAFTIGALPYWWPRAATLAFYAGLADGPADCVVLGETVCSRRNEMKPGDWLALARELRDSGLEVVLATLPLLSSEAEWRAVRELAAQEEFLVEAGDASALHALELAGEQRGRAPRFVIGPHLNVYNPDALREHAALGAVRWTAPVELAAAAIAHVNPPGARICGPHGDLATEAWGFGRLPLALSARCFTARHHRLRKDACDFRCRDDADGLRLDSTEGQPFLCINGTQIQSAGLHAVLGEWPALRAAGVGRLRLSPCSRGFADVLRTFDAVCNAQADPADGLRHLREIDLPGTLVDGYARGAPGMAQALA
jgi:collagenase-like PrtC family protease